MIVIALIHRTTSLITHCNETKDPLVPSVWGAIDKKDDPFASTDKNGCCIVM
jgi:guanine nucleotide-binding protein subunit gamma